LIKHLLNKHGKMLNDNDDDDDDNVMFKSYYGSINGLDSADTSHMRDYYFMIATYKLHLQQILSE
jgi:hypothetical protein